jgi:hypothetical protein
VKEVDDEPVLAVDFELKEEMRIQKEIFVFQ